MYFKVYSLKYKCLLYYIIQNIKLYFELCILRCKSLCLDYILCKRSKKYFEIQNLH